VQTFLPYSDFYKSGYALDPRRLGKQRVETLQILNSLFENKGWVNHPAVKMWRGYEQLLAVYGLTMCIIWVDKYGFKDTCYSKIGKYITSTNIFDIPCPPWLGDEEFHESHRSNLMRKDPVFYAHFAATTREGLEYKWPVK
jgi:hypothetical protein